MSGAEPDLMTGLRTGRASDRVFVIEMARLACALADGPIPPSDDPEVLALLPNDVLGNTLIAEDDGQPVGAPWWYMPEPPLVCDGEGRALPELVVAVIEHARGRGGTQLVDAVASRAAEKHSALALNVHLLNPAVRHHTS